jgi:hypothetical protein
MAVPVKAVSTSAAAHRAASGKWRRSQGPGLGGSNRCLKSAKQAGSGPAARTRDEPSTRSIPYPDCPLLTRADRCSVPPMCPNIHPIAVGSIADGISNTRSIACSGGDLARPGPGPADRGAAGAVRGAARRRPGYHRCGGGQRRALPPCRWHQDLEPDAAGRPAPTSGIRPAARWLPRPSTNAAVAHTAKPRPDQDDRQLQEPQWPTPTSKNTVGSGAPRMDRDRQDDPAQRPRTTPVSELLRRGSALLTTALLRGTVKVAAEGGHVGVVGAEGGLADLQGPARVLAWAAPGRRLGGFDDLLASAVSGRPLGAPQRTAAAAPRPRSGHPCRPGCSR